MIAPNKTLAAQLYTEFKELFPTNAVEYFVSYYDYYQPEAYVPQTDTYIEKMPRSTTRSTSCATLPPVRSRNAAMSSSWPACPVSMVWARRRITAACWSCSRIRWR